MAESLIFFVAGFAIGGSIVGWHIGQWVFDEICQNSCEAMNKIVRRVLMHGFDRDYMINAVNNSGFFKWKSGQDNPEIDR